MVSRRREPWDIPLHHSPTRWPVPAHCRARARGQAETPGPSQSRSKWQSLRALCLDRGWGPRGWRRCSSQATGLRVGVLLCFRGSEVALKEHEGPAPQPTPGSAPVCLLTGGRPSYAHSKRRPFPGGQGHLTPPLGISQPSAPARLSDMSS